MRGLLGRDKLGGHGRGKRPGARRHRVDDVVQHDPHVLLPHPQVLRTRPRGSCARLLRGANAGTARSGGRKSSSSGTSTVTGLPLVAQRIEVVRLRAVQRRRHEHRALDVEFRAVHQRELGAETPAEQPTVQASPARPRSAPRPARRPPRPRPRQSALRRPARRGRAARVEAQHRDVGERGQAPRGLAQHVRVHEPAVSGQRVQGDEGRGDAARCAASASSPTSVRPSSVTISMSSRHGGQHRHGADLDCVSHVISQRFPSSSCANAAAPSLADIGAEDPVRRPRDDVLLAAGDLPTASGTRVGLVRGPRDRDEVVLAARADLPASAKAALSPVHDRAPGAAVRRGAWWSGASRA